MCLEEDPVGAVAWGFFRHVCFCVCVSVGIYMTETRAVSVIILLIALGVYPKRLCLLGLFIAKQKSPFQIVSLAVLGVFLSLA
jgi:hypothetical protein